MVEKKLKHNITYMHRLQYYMKMKMYEGYGTRTIVLTWCDNTVTCLSL